MIELDEITAFGITEEDLSQTGQGLAAIIGLPLTLKVIAEYQGRKVYIPASAEKGSNLVKVIGMDAVDQLGEFYGCERISIPMERDLRRKIRDRKLIKKHRDGCHVNQLAKDFGLSARQVWQILAVQKATNKGDK